MNPASHLETENTFDMARQPFPIRLANHLGKFLDDGFNLRIDLSQSQLIATARRKAKLYDFGENSYEEPLSIFLNSIEHESQINFMGRIMLRQMVLTALTNRLLINAKISNSPDLLNSPIDQPLFIVGYPRTGTTLLHNLLALDPQNRTLKMYETLSPAARNPVPSAHKDPRISQAERFIKATHYISRHISVIHPLSAKGPDECLKLIENTFISPHFMLYCHIPTYWAWLLEQKTCKFIPVYEYHRSQLQILGKQKHEKRWVLKAPIHLFFIDALLKVYPDARIIYLHRNPASAIPSFCSLTAASRALASDVTDKKDIGSFAVDLYEESTKRAKQARNAGNSSALFYDVHYDDLLANPFKTIQNIYSFFGYAQPQDLEIHINNWITHNPQNKHGKHHYSLESYKLNTKSLEKLTKF